MGQVPVAAFDPIFWMHHALVGHLYSRHSHLTVTFSNIDRIFAIYQTLTDKDEKRSWWVSDTISYTDDNGENKTLTLTPKTPLHPFHSDDKGATYDSNGIRQIAKLGYAYPELQRWRYPPGPSGEVKYRANLIKRIRQLYAPPGTLLAQISRKDYIVNVVYER